MEKELTKKEFVEKGAIVSSLVPVFEKVAKCAVKQFLTPQEAQAVFGISRQYLSYLSKMGCFPRYCVSKSVTLYRYDEIEGWLLTRRQEGDTKWSTFEEDLARADNKRL